MTDVIKVTVNENHFVSCSTETIARKGEGQNPRLLIEIPEKFVDMWPYLDFKKPSGATFKTPRLDVVGNTIEYSLPLSVLDEKGTLEMQLVLQNGSGLIWKSNVKHFYVLYSIDATGDIADDEDFVDYVENMIENALSELELVCIVPELPKVGTPNKTYFVPKKNGADNDLYDEWMWINDDWEYFGTKTIEVDLTDYVKNTDFASETNAGVAKTTYRYGIITDGNGFLSIYPATNAHIDGKSVKNPIAPNNLDYAVKVGVTTNEIELTDEEKTAACEWLGTLKKHKPTNPQINLNYVYGSHWSTGEQIMIALAHFRQAPRDSLVIRGYKGAIYIPDIACEENPDFPTGEIAVNKKYVDGLAVDRSQGVVSFEADGTQTNILWHYNAMGGTIARRMGNGTLWVATPDHDSAAANKAYVDAVTPFIATYGETTLEEITAAVNAGRACFCLIKEGNYKGCVIPMSHHSTAFCVFSKLHTATSPNTTGMASELSVWCMGARWTDVKTQALAYQ